MNQIGQFLLVPMQQLSLDSKDEGDFTNAGFHNQEVKNVSVPNGISGGFTIDGQSKPTLTLERGKIYRFDTSSSTMSSHPIHFGNTTEEVHQQQFMEPRLELQEQLISLFIRSY